jgi:hypothetical protein
LLSDLFNIHENDTLSSADHNTSSGLANVALQSEGDFLGCFSFLSENRLGLTSVTRLLSVVTSSSLSGLAFFTFLILGNFMDGVQGAFVAVGFSSLRNDHHFCD